MLLFKWYALIFFGSTIHYLISRPLGRIKFGNPQPRCDSCQDRKYWYAFGRGCGDAQGQCYKKRCSKCSIDKSPMYEIDSLGQDFNAALQWFKASKAPGKSFDLYPDTVVPDPILAWDSLRLEIESGNIYCLERIREDLIRLHELFGDDDDF